MVKLKKNPIIIAFLLANILVTASSCDNKSQRQAALQEKENKLIDGFATTYGLDEKKKIDFKDFVENERKESLETVQQTIAELEKIVNVLSSSNLLERNAALVLFNQEIAEMVTDFSPITDPEDARKMVEEYLLPILKNTKEQLQLG